MAKRIIYMVFVVCSFSNVYSQEDLIKEIQKLTLANDSLQKLVKAEKNTMDNLIKQQSDSIAVLKKGITEANNRATEEKKRGEQKARTEYERGKREALDIFTDTYKNKPFDDLIGSSTKMLVRRDIQILDNNAEIKSVLTDLEKYFNSQELLGKKYDGDKIKNASTQLNQINRESVLLEKLKKSTENYSLLNEGLKEVIEKITELDKREAVFGMSDEIQKMKLNKILPEISAYIFNYDFNSTDYPYLSDIVLEIIKRKQPNPDADISDLLNKL